MDIDGENVEAGEKSGGFTTYQTGPEDADMRLQEIKQLPVLFPHNYEVIAAEYHSANENDGKRMCFLVVNGHVSLPGYMRESLGMPEDMAPPMSCVIAMNATLADACREAMRDILEQLGE